MDKLSLKRIFQITLKNHSGLCRGEARARAARTPSPEQEPTGTGGSRCRAARRRSNTGSARSPSAHTHPSCAERQQRSGPRLNPPAARNGMPWKRKPDSNRQQQSLSRLRAIQTERCPLLAQGGSLATGTETAQAVCYWFSPLLSSAAGRSGPSVLQEECVLYLMPTHISNLVRNAPHGSSPGFNSHSGQLKHLLV